MKLDHQLADRSVVLNRFSSGQHDENVFQMSVSQLPWVVNLGHPLDVLSRKNATELTKSFCSLPVPSDGSFFTKRHN